MEQDTPDPKVPDSEQPVSQDDILELNFVPQWAREQPDQAQYAYEERPERGRRDFRGGGGGGRGGGQGGGGRGGSGRGGSGGFRDQRGQGNRRDGGQRGRDGQRDQRDRGDRQGGPRGEQRADERTSFTRDDSRSAPPARARFPHHLDITFLPERHGLGVLVRKIKSTQRAYPLAKLASLCLSKPEFYLVKIESLPPSEGAEAHSLYQCQDSGALFLDRASWERYAVSHLLESTFEKYEEEGDPPSGNFVCVARCGLSGEILGPPNYHGYTDRLKEIWRTRYARMPFEDYCARIQTVRDPEAVETWKQNAAKRTLYRPKDAGEDQPGLTADEAQAQLLEGQGESRVKTVRRAIVPSDLVMKHGETFLQQRVRDAWNRESRFPGSLLRALRPAFRHMGLYTFKINGNQTFITLSEPHPLNPDKAVPAIRDVLLYLQDHAGCSRADLLQGLHPETDPASPEAAGLLLPLRWLVEKGHVIEFFDGTLALPMRR